MVMKGIKVLYAGQAHKLFNNYDSSREELFNFIYSEIERLAVMTHHAELDVTDFPLALCHEAARIYDDAGYEVTFDGRTLFLKW